MKCHRGHVWEDCTCSLEFAMHEPHLINRTLVAFAVAVGFGLLSVVALYGLGLL